MLNKIKLLVISTAILLSQLDLGFNEPQAFECKDEIVQIPSKVIPGNVKRDISTDTSSTAKDKAIERKPLKKNIPKAETVSTTLNFFQNVITGNHAAQNIILDNTDSLYMSFETTFPIYPHDQESGVSKLMQFYDSTELGFLKLKSINKIDPNILKQCFDNFRRQSYKNTKNIIENDALNPNFVTYHQTAAHYANNLNLSKINSNLAFRDTLPANQNSLYISSIRKYAAHPAALLETSFEKNGKNPFYTIFAKNMNRIFAGKSTPEALKIYAKLMYTGNTGNLNSTTYSGDLEQLIFHPNEDLSNFLHDDPQLLYEYDQMSLQVNAVSMNVGTSFIDPQMFFTFCYLLYKLEENYGEKYKYSLNEAFFLYTHFFAGDTQFESTLNKCFEHTGKEAKRHFAKKFNQYSYSSETDLKVGSRNIILYKYLINHIVIPNLEFYLFQWAQETDFNLNKKYSEEEEVKIIQDFLNYYFEKTNNAHYLDYL